MTVFNDNMKQMFHSRLQISGIIFIASMKLKFSKYCTIPTVNAASKNGNSKKPPPMKYTELPIYSCPHYEYKNSKVEKAKGEEYKVRLLHETLLPYVTMGRRKVCSMIESLKPPIRSVGETAEKSVNFISYTATEFKNGMRCPKNEKLRLPFMAATTLFGLWLGSGRGIPRKIFFSSIGALAGGAICYPKETDEIFKSVCCVVGTNGAVVVRKFFGKDQAKEEVPCAYEVPPAVDKVTSQCPKPKK